MLPQIVDGSEQCVFILTEQANGPVALHAEEATDASTARLLARAARMVVVDDEGAPGVVATADRASTTLGRDEIVKLLHRESVLLPKSQTSMERLATSTTPEEVPILRLGVAVELGERLHHLAGAARLHAGSRVDLRRASTPRSSVTLHAPKVAVARTGTSDPSQFGVADPTVGLAPICRPAVTGEVVERPHLPTASAGLRHPGCGWLYGSAGICARSRRYHCRISDDASGREAISSSIGM